MEEEIAVDALEDAVEGIAGVGAEEGAIDQRRVRLCDITSRVQANRSSLHAWWVSLSTLLARVAL